MQDLDFERLDFYALLGIERNATADEIKQAYRQQIIRYHPDRYMRGAPEEQEYARQRTLRINEAYSTLSNFAVRSAYNRNGSTAQRKVVQTPAKAPAPPAPRDHQAEMYAQARAHIDAGHTIQALAILRQLQKINPFYRDTATLIATIEENDTSAKPTAAATTTDAQATESAQRTRRRIIGGAVGSAVVAGVVAAAVGLRGQANKWFASAPVNQGSATAPSIASGPTLAPNVASNPTSLPPSPTLAPNPTNTPQPTIEPTQAATATTAPTRIVEQGELLLEDGFRAGGWASQQNVGWTVGYTSDRLYRITADPRVGNIWSYRTIQGTTDYSVGVDVVATDGSAGILVRYQDRNNYVVCLITPATGAYRIEQRNQGRTSVIDSGTSSAIDTAPGATNRVVAAVIDSQVELRVNGLSLAEQDVPRISQTQQYGVVAVAGENTVEALFDNLEVRAITLP